MNIPQLILSIVDVAAAIFLIAVVLLQSGKSAGLSGAIAGVADTFMAKNRAKTWDAKLAKMTKEEKAQYMQKKKEKELSDREAAVTRSELMAEAKNNLSDEGLPVELAEVLNYTDADACKKSMETVKKAFQTAVEKAVDEKLKGGKPPKKAPETNTQEALEKQVYNAMMGIF